MRRRKKWKKAPQARSKQDKCITKWCRNRRAQKSNGYYLKHCWKCRSRMFKKNCPATYVLNMLQHSARKRDLAFTLTLAQFKEFCFKTGYLEHRGCQPDALTVDRINRNEGYHIWNLRVLTHEENSRQGADNAPRDTADTDEPTTPYEIPDDEPF